MNELQGRFRVCARVEAARLDLDEGAADGLAFVHTSFFGITDAFPWVEAKEGLDFSPVQRTSGTNHPAEDLCGGFSSFGRWPIENPDRNAFITGFRVTRCPFGKRQ